MTLKIVTRADLGWPSSPIGGWIAANTNLGMIAHYDGARHLLDDWKARGHAACVSYWKATRTAHMKGNGWRDVGYAYFDCPCGTVLEGRCYGHVQAAEMPTPGKMQGGNVRYVAVTFGLGPGERPTAAAVTAFLELRAKLMRDHKMAGTVLGHRDFTSTDCPGDVIYLMTRDGTLEAKEDPQVKFPPLRAGVRSYDVLTLRGLLFERFLAARFEPADKRADLYPWLRDQDFTPELKTDVIAYQKWAFPDEPSQWDGVVGDRTWAKLARAI